MTLATFVIVGLAVIALLHVSSDEFPRMIRARRQRRSGADPKLDELIKPPKYRFTKHDEALEQQTRKRREAAALFRTRAHRVEAGGKGSDVLRWVKK